MSNYVHVYDIESASSTKKNGIDLISLCCVVADIQTLQPVDKMVLYIKPSFPEDWNKWAQDVHKITKSTAMGFPEKRESSLKLLHFLKDYRNLDNSPTPFIMHSNAYVDYRAISQMYESEGLSSSFNELAEKEHSVRTDLVFKEYRRTLGDTVRSISKLSYACEEFDIPLNHHEVESDTLGCLHVLRNLVQYFKPRGGAKPLPSSVVDYTVFNMLCERYNAPLADVLNTAKTLFEADQTSITVAT